MCIRDRLKVAPEHVSDKVLAKMGKPGGDVYQRFVKKYQEINQRLGMDQDVYKRQNKYRIEQAKKRMDAEPEAKVYTIAEETGFSDYKYFAFIFKKYTGYTPTSYRNR